MCIIMINLSYKIMIILKPLPSTSIPATADKNDKDRLSIAECALASNEVLKRSFSLLRWILASLTVYDSTKKGIRMSRMTQMDKKQ